MDPQKVGDLERVLFDAKTNITNNQAIEAMFRYVESDLPRLQAVRAWANSLKGLIQPTPVGLAVGYSNMRRFNQLDGLNSLADVIGS